MKKQLSRFFAALLATAVFAGLATALSLPAVKPSKVTGNIISAGSSTVYPVMEKMAEKFKKEGYKGNITIDSIGTGAGFERFCKTGETDIANASRPIKDKEKEACSKLASPRTVIEFRLGTDALAVVVSSKNKFADNLSMEDLAKVFSTAETWADINPAWPKEPIKRFIPGTDSGTFDYFVEEVFKKDKKPILAAANLQLSEDDNVLVKGIEGSPYGIGFFGYAYYEANKKKVKILKIKGVEGNKANVDNGKYPLARPLFIYTAVEIIKSKPQIASFINYLLTNVSKDIQKIGYFPAPKDAIEKSMKLWLDSAK